ncbi:MAG: tetratricopeptide repeat protein [Gemmatimonadetes bacterium]|nr:tetratricopeptide repeat protein [Gemmatimonadota bacterium]
MRILQSGKVEFFRGNFISARKKLYPFAEQGNADAQHIIGLIMQDIDQDFLEAVKWFKCAADQGHSHAQFDLGMIYRFGLGVPRDEKEAVKWFKRAADQSHVHARHELSYCCRGIRQSDSRQLCLRKAQKPVKN